MIKEGIVVTVADDHLMRVGSPPEMRLVRSLLGRHRSPTR
jgi:hypothetical protein